MTLLHLHRWVESTRTRKMALFYPELVGSHVQVLGVRTNEAGALRCAGCEPWPGPSGEGGRAWSSVIDLIYYAREKLDFFFFLMCPKEPHKEQ